MFSIQRPPLEAAGHFVLGSGLVEGLIIQISAFLKGFQGQNKEQPFRLQDHTGICKEARGFLGPVAKGFEHLPRKNQLGLSTSGRDRVT